VAFEATGFSLVKVFRRASKIGNNQKETPERTNQAFNFFKHADRDIDKEIHFDNRITDHFLYIAICDLKRTRDARPDKDDYTILIAAEVEEFYKYYTASYGRDPSSLVGLQKIVAHESGEMESACVKHIQNWLRSRTDFFEERRV
jgi:hypothetical protein